MGGWNGWLWGRAKPAGGGDLGCTTGEGMKIDEIVGFRE